MATLQGKAVKNTYRQVLQIGANNVGVSGALQPVQDGAGVNTALSLSTAAATINGTLTITGDLIITGGGIQITDLIDDTVATLIQNGTGITWAYNDTLRTLTPTITIATADGGVQGDFMQLNTGAGEANAVAKIYWNSSDGTAELGLMGGQVILPIGQKQVARVLNNSGTTFTKAGYQVVKITAAQGQRLAVGLAQANNDANSTDTLGLVAENIANNQEGFITTSGLITNVDTTGDLQLEDWNDGDILYLSPTTPGAITKVKPIAPQHTIIVGFVVYAHKNNGKIYVKVDNGYELDELHNVRITAVADNNILQYNSSLAVWENVAGTTTNLAEGTNLYYTQARFDSAFAAKTTTNLAEGTNLYFTTARGDANFATNFATKTTTNLPEGTNLYYTDTRARLALSVTAGTGISYNNGTGVFNLASIPNASLTNSSVTVNSLALPLGGSITLTTTNIAEGTNLYWTNARFDSRFGTKTTTDLAEGTNLYYTQARFNTAFDAKTTTDLDEGTNLYYTDARSRAAFSENAVGLDYSSGSGVLSLTSGYAIPTTVKLGQYDTAYNRSIVSAAVTGTGTKTLSLTQQDANVVTASWTDLGITTINGTANQIAATTVGNTTTLAFTNDVTMPNNLVVSGNLTINGTATYVNTQSISSKDPLFEVANDNNTTDAVDIGYYGRYFDSAQTRVEFTGLFRDASDAGKFKFFTGLVNEPTNVVDTTGTGYTVGTLVANFEGNLAGTANAANQLSTARSISATGDAAWTVNFDGSANATASLTLANTGVTASTYGTTTAVPTIAIDSKGRITSASNTNIAFPVTTVNGASGTVVLTTSNIAEGSNQYFTSARAQASITGGASSVVTADLTASRALVSDGSGKIAASASTTAIEIGYVAGVTSAIQTQLNTKALDSNTVHISGTETITGAKTFSGGLASNALTLTGALGGTSATFTQTTSNKLTLSGGSTQNGLTLDAVSGFGNSFYIFNGNGGLGNGFGIFNNTTSTLPFHISNAGAATFAGTLTVTGASGGNSITVSQGIGTGGDITINKASAASFIANNTSASGKSYRLLSADDGTFRIQNTGVLDLVTITSSGAASFSSTLSTGGAINVSYPVTDGGSVINITNTQTTGLYNTAAINLRVYNGTSVTTGGGFFQTFNGFSYLQLASNQTNLYGLQSGGIRIATVNAPIVFSNGNADADSSTARLTIASTGAATFSSTLTASGTINASGGRVNILGSNQNSIWLNQNAGGTSTGFLIGRSLTTTDSQDFFIFDIAASATRMAINSSGAITFGSLGTGTVTATSGTLSTVSDMNLKDEDGFIDNALEKVLKLKPRYFHWKEESGLPTDLRQLGFYAQEVNEALGEEAANTPKTENDKWGIYDRGMIAFLTKAIQELKAEIDELKAK
jgi:hypothetical protein